MSEGAAAEKSHVSQVRSALLRSSKPKVEQVEYAGFEIELRQMKLKDRRDLFNQCRTEEGNIDAIDLIVRTIIRCAYDAQSGERIFEDADYETLMEQHGDLVDALTPAINRLTGADEETVGNENSGSGETRSDGRLSA